MLFDRSAEVPFRLQDRQYIDFTQEFDAAVARLREHLSWQASPAGVLQALKDRLADARRDLRRAGGPAQRARVEEDIALLKQQAEAQKRVVDDPQAAAQRVDQNIKRGLERERRCEVVVLNGFSAHADQRDLLAYADRCRERGRLERIALVHGELGPQQVLAGLLRERGHAKIAIPAAGEALDLL